MASPVNSKSASPPSREDLNRYFDRCGLPKIGLVNHLVPLSASRIRALFTYPDISQYVKSIWEPPFIATRFKKVIQFIGAPGDRLEVSDEKIKNCLLQQPVLLPSLLDLVYQYLAPIKAFFICKSAPCPDKGWIEDCQSAVLFVGGLNPTDSDQQLFCIASNGREIPKAPFFWNKTKKEMQINPNYPYTFYFNNPNIEFKRMAKPSEEC